MHSWFTISSPPSRNTSLSTFSGLSCARAVVLICGNFFKSWSANCVKGNVFIEEVGNGVCNGFVAVVFRCQKSTAGKEALYWRLLHFRRNGGAIVLWGQSVHPCLFSWRCHYSILWHGTCEDVESNSAYFLPCFWQTACKFDIEQNIPFSRFLEKCQTAFWLILPEQSGNYELVSVPFVSTAIYLSAVFDMNFLDPSSQTPAFVTSESKSTMV